MIEGELLRTILLVTSLHKDPSLYYTREVSLILARAGCTILAGEACRPLECRYLKIIDLNDREQYASADFVVVLGGDGTIIKAARRAAYLGVPVLSINLGRIGYLAELECDQIHMIPEILDGKCTLGERMMLDAQVMRDGKAISKIFTALNDIVVSNGTVSRLVEFEMTCDDCFVSGYRADGVIASTPTGSTAYSMSAGGAIVDPKLECICITPVCPHALGARPLIFDAASVIELTNISELNDSIYMTVDGRENIRLALGDTVRILKSPLTTKFIKVKHDTFYSVLHTKISE